MAEKQEITKDMRIGELIRQHPEAAMVMMQHGMHCVGCPMSSMETVEQGTVGHGMSEEALEELLEALNKEIEEKKE